MAFRITDGCTGCAECAPHCPTAAILRGPGNEHFQIDESRCIACGACSMVCPTRAAVDEQGSAFSLQIRTLVTHRHARVMVSMCDGCGACIECCPFDAIRLLGCAAVVSARQCTGCTLCELECTRGAIESVRPGSRVLCIEP